MNLANSEELNLLLKSHGIRLTKDLGQHFLVDENALDEIIAAAEIQKEDKILETGTGVGTLTVCLAEKSDHVLAVELDERMIGVLRANLGVSSNVEIQYANALDIENPTEKWKWVANLPYQITSPLLKKYLANENPPQVAVLMVQKELGEKICDKKESRISLLVKNFMEAEKVCDVKRESFFPPPKVDSVVIKLTRLKNPIISLEKWSEAEKIMKLAFMNKRKKLRNTLKPFFGSEVEEKLEAVEIDPNMRPEELSLEEWKNLIQL